MRYIAVMDAGRFVERGTARDVTSLPRHSRTGELLAAATAFGLEGAAS